MRARVHRRPGFTLLETMMALVIIGVGVLAFVDAQTSFIRSNNWSSRAATGMLLANEIREMTRRLPRHDPVTGLSMVTVAGGATSLVGWGRETSETQIDDLDDLDDLDGLTFGVGGNFSGPVSAFGDLVKEIGLDGTVAVSGDGVSRGLEGWSQHVTIEKVDPYNFSTVRAKAYEQAATAQLPFIRVDQFPVRVTVVVNFQGPEDANLDQVSKMTWIVIP